MNADILTEIIALPNKSPAELKKLWQNIFATTAPPYNKSFYVKRIAYRLQEIAYGADSSEVERKCAALVKRKADEKAKVTEVHRPVAGTQLLRGWNGEEHCVTVLAEGFEYRKIKYNSLSAIATKITGTKWNGLVFFGVKRTTGARRK